MTLLKSGEMQETSLSSPFPVSWPGAMSCVAMFYHNELTSDTRSHSILSFKLCQTLGHNANKVD